MSTRVELPAGEWFFLNKLPIDVTVEEIQEFFWRCGLDLPSDRIYIYPEPDKMNSGFRSVAISIDKMIMAQFLLWGINGARLRDSHPVIPTVGKKEREQQQERFRYGK
jgi:hypothetical protein